MLNVPIIFRIVRDGDPVPRLPPCRKGRKCKNKLKMKTFPKTAAEILGNVKEDSTYWHIGGLILYDNEMKEFIDCGREESENPSRPECISVATLVTENHTFYFNVQVSKICKGIIAGTKQALKKKLNLKKKIKN